MTDRLWVNIKNLPQQLAGNLDYMATNSLLELAYNSFNRLMPFAEDGSMMDRMNISLRQGVLDTSKMVIQADHPCHVEDKEKEKHLKEDLKQFLPRFYASSPYILLFGGVDFLTRFLIGDDGTLESAVIAAQDPSSLMKSSIANGVAFVGKQALWNGFGSTEEFKEYDYEEKEEEKEPEVGGFMNRVYGAKI